MSGDGSDGFSDSFYHGQIKAFRRLHGSYVQAVGRYNNGIPPADETARHTWASMEAVTRSIKLTIDEATALCALSHVRPPEDALGGMSPKSSGGRVRPDDYYREDNERLMIDDDEFERTLPQRIRLALWAAIRSWFRNLFHGD